MKICALLFVLGASLFTIAADLNPRQEFLSFYYKGDYEKAHAKLSSGISDPVIRQIWESRLHIQENISDCSFVTGTNRSADAFAHLSIGQFDSAISRFSDDWISLWGKAVFAYWNADPVTARRNIQQALALQPENPELLFFAGDVAETAEKTIEYFTHFLKLDPEDQTKRDIAEFSIELMKKTAGMDLNIIRVEKGVQELETDYVRSGVVVSATVNSREKLKLLVDTGAGSGLVFEPRKWTPQVVNDVVMLGLGKKPISTSKRVVLDHFQTGNFSIQNPLATENETMPFPDIDGLVGSAVFGTHRILLPVKAGKNLILLPYEMNAPDYLAANGNKFKTQRTVPFFPVNNLIIIKGRIKKSPDDLDILIDTGADTSLVSMATAKKHAHINYPLSMQMRRQSSVSGVGGKADNLLIAENVEVGIADLSKNFNNMLAINFAETSEALGLEIDLLLGRDFLEGYSLLIDYRNRQLTFLK